MSYVPLEEVLDKVNGSLYKLVVLAAKRAAQISEGAQVLTENIKKEDKPTIKALQELREGKIAYEILEKKKGSKKG